MPKLTIGTKLCKCAACGEFFTTPANFDSHRSGKGLKRVCLDPGQMRDKHGKAVFRHNVRGFWAKTGGIYTGPGK